MTNLLATKRKEELGGDAATIAVILRDKKILLGLRDYQDGPTVWTAPGGSVDTGETLESAVRRETKEETGIDDLTLIDYVGIVKADERDELHIFHCESEGEPELCEPEKFNEWIWYPLKDFAAGELDNYINEPSREVIVDYLAENDIL